MQQLAVVATLVHVHVLAAGAAMVVTAVMLI